MRHSLINRVAQAVVLLLALSAAPAGAIGYWNVPGNVCQWWGYGWGAGHHACFVLGPVSQDGAFAHREVRLPYAPQPPYGYCCGGNFYYDFREPSQVMPAGYQPAPHFAEPTPALSPETLTPEVLPAPDARQAPTMLFPAPVER